MPTFETLERIAKPLAKYIEDFGKGVYKTAVDIKPSFIEGAKKVIPPAVVIGGGALVVSEAGKYITSSGVEAAGNIRAATTLITNPDTQAVREEVKQIRDIVNTYLTGSENINARTPSITDKDGINKNTKQQEEPPTSQVSEPSKGLASTGLTPLQLALLIGAVALGAVYLARRK
jgi:hypothetical protein